MTDRIYLKMKRFIHAVCFLVLGWGNVVDLRAEERGSPNAVSVVSIEGVDYPVFQLEDLKPLKRVSPRYPIREGEGGVSANVVVLVLVDRAGLPVEVSLKDGKTPPAFGDEAIKAVKQWRFRPANWRGEPTEYIMQVPLVFRARR